MKPSQAVAVLSIFEEIENRAGPPSLAILAITSCEEVSQSLEARVGVEITPRKPEALATLLVPYYHYRWNGLA